MRQHPGVTAGIYLHIPFCRIKCPYCDFNTYTGMQDRIPSYVDALISELELRVGSEPQGSQGPLRSIYFGGGTPSLLTPAQVEGLLAAIQQHVPVSENLEVTLEANPGTVDVDRLRAFKSAGVTRLTLGVQTFSPRLLASLGRLHTVEESLQAVDAAVSAGFDNLNIDLMFGLPEQSVAEWTADLEQGLALPVGHISLYNLTIEDGTPFGREQKQGRLSLPDEEHCRAMYVLAIEESEAAGFDRYEVSNFARPGLECQHNRLYWEGDSWLGLGAGAHGFTATTGDWGRRWWNVRGPGAYVAMLREGTLPEDGSELLDERMARDEALMLGLRRSEGLDLARFERRFGVDPRDLADPVLARALQSGFLTLADDALRTTKDGVIIVDYLISSLSSALDSAGRSDSLVRPS